TFVSPSWYEFTGLVDGAALGNGWIEAIDPGDRERWRRRVEVAHRTHEPFQMEYRLRHCDGGCHWVMDTAEPHFDEEGTFRGLVGSVVDISDWKDMEEELQG